MNIGHTAIEISAATERNLRKLASYLLALPEDYGHFNMRFYAQFEDDLSDKGEMKAAKGIEHTCGAVACAVGHGPAAGITVKRSTSWDQYCGENFEAGYTSQNKNSSIIFHWCFGSEWSYHDDTPQGAAKRIFYMLKNGVPDVRMSDAQPLYADCVA